MTRFTRRRFLGTTSALLGDLSLPTRLAKALNEPAASNDLTLWYEKPAAQWIDALPIGNGRLGAMVFGGGEDGAFNKELLQFNEDTLWSGQPRDGNNRDAKNHLAAIRAAVLEQQDYHLADQLCRKMQGLFAESYQPLGNLRLDLTHSGPSKNFRRQLDLDTARVTSSYEVEGVQFQREAFVSAPDQVLVLRVTGSKPHHISGVLTLDGPLPKTVKALTNNRLLLTGKAAVHIAGAGHPHSEQPVTLSDEPGAGMYFAALVELHVEGGTATASANPTGITIANATSFAVLVTAATGYRGFQLKPDLSLEEITENAKRPLEAAATKPFATLYTRHLEDHQRLFRRVSLSLGPPNSTKPTDQRLKEFAASPDPSLLALYFQYGRYLLISSSRQNSQPANLQGIWNYEVTPPWSSNWTANINIQMNYWHAETTNLGECTGPLFDLIDGLSKTGAITAQETYGLPGWCSHHNIDIWRASNPVSEGVGSPTWANWCMSGPWLCAHLYEHYLFTRDREFLRTRAYPLMKGAAEFCLAWLIEDGKGHLTTCHLSPPRTTSSSPTANPL
jgi:alpha-L-fucosidase 2